MAQIKKLSLIAFTLAISATFSGCATFGGGLADELNPYADAGPNLGERTTAGISGGGQESDRARHALEVMATYRKAQTPQPIYPVIQPAEVRLMWVPDHINKYNDLVPAHYYYLKVKNDDFAVQDAYELEKQVGDGSDGGRDLGSAAGRGSGTPWVYKDQKQGK